MLPSLQQIRQLLVCSQDGGVIPTLSIRQVLPEAVITLLVPNRTQALLPGVDQVLIHPEIDGAAAAVQDLIAAIQGHQFEAAIIFTGVSQSPYPLAYACYLAGIPLRIGQSAEFGGGVLSHWVKPPDQKLQDRNLFLLESVGLAIAGSAPIPAEPPQARGS